MHQTKPNRYRYLATFVIQDTPAHKRTSNGYHKNEKKKKIYIKREKEMRNSNKSKQ